MDFFMEGWQRFFAALGHPLGHYGEFIYMRRAVFDDVGGFNPRLVHEDTDFAARAWWRGWKLDVFPFEVMHLRQWNPEHYGIPSSVWGLE
jgi:hypothetical protein